MESAMGVRENETQGNIHIRLLHINRKMQICGFIHLKNRTAQL